MTEYIPIILAASGLVGCLLGSSRQRPVMGFILGATLGPIGWVLVICLNENRGLSSWVTNLVFGFLAMVAAAFLFGYFGFQLPAGYSLDRATSPYQPRVIVAPPGRSSPQQQNDEILRKYGN
jgi:hypothetical protein